MNGYDWAAQEGIWVLEPYGWTNDGRSMDEEITYDDYRNRVLNSVIGPIPAENLNA